MSNLFKVLRKYGILISGDDYMPNHILAEDFIDEMIENVSLIKLSTYLQFNKEDDTSSFY